jgi:GAF domain-containing protein
VSPTDSAPALPPVNEDITQRRLLQSIVEVACRVFKAAAASVFLVDPGSGDLVFEAVAGEGEEWLVGKHFPSGTGIAGWVAMFGQPLLIDDVTQSELFARDAAESTGYLPRSIMAAPLFKGRECIGVLEVLDRGSRPHGDLGELDLLGLLATETALALEMLIQLRWGSGTASGPRSAPLGADDLALLQRVADRLPAAGPAAPAVRKLLTMADELLAMEGGPVPSPG